MSFRNEEIMKGKRFLIEDKLIRNMKYKAEINVMPHKELLDPQGKTVTKNMKNLEIQGVEDVRIGKRIVMTLEAENQDEAKSKVDNACKNLLANMIMETYEFDILELNA